MNAFETLSNIDVVKYEYDLRDLCRGTRALWKSVSTFRQLCDLNVLYISGLLVTSPYHMGPILSESDPIIRQLAQCNRNLIFTVSSEPCQKGRDIINNEEFEVKNASIELWIRNHNVELLLSSLNRYENRFEIEKLEDCTLSDEVGENFSNHDDVTSRFFITDKKEGTNEMYDILSQISSQFTEFPISK